MERFDCGNASLREVIFFISWDKNEDPRSDYKHFVEALHDGSRCGVWTREGEWKARVFINDSKHVCILRL